METHKAATLFPLLEGTALDELVADIKANGLLHDIVLFDGAILDGRNRARACELAGVVATYVTVTGVDPLDYVVSANLHRRQLTTGQRAMIASELATMRHGYGPGRGHKKEKSKKLSFSVTRNDAAKLLDVSKSSVGRARQIARERPDLVEQVKTGKMKLSVASDRARVNASRKRPIKDAIVDDLEQAERNADLADIARAVTLAKTADEKLRVAIRVHKKILDNEYNQRITEALQPMLVQYNKEHDAYVAANNAHKGLYSPEEYKRIISALHSDRYASYDLDATTLKRLDTAFHLIEAKRFALCGVRNEPPGDLPRTVADLMAMRKK
jgi:hypothetical protein